MPTIKIEDQKRRAQERLETLLLEGLKSGKATPLTKKDMERIRRAAKARVVKRKK
jgi:antitoxin ParD1/3/4